MIDTDFTLEQAVFNTEAFIIATIVDDNNYPLCSRHSSIVLDEDTVISKIGDSPLVKHSNPGSIRASILLPRAISPITAEGPTPIRW